jgi:erythrin-vacuolar iron transport family protein
MPVLRGLVGGLMTIAGRIVRTLPYLIPDFLAATVVAGGIVLIELLAISQPLACFRFHEHPV